MKCVDFVMCNPCGLCKRGVLWEIMTIKIKKSTYKQVFFTIEKEYKKWTILE